MRFLTVFLLCLLTAPTFTQESADSDMEIPPRFFEFDAISYLKINIASEDYEQRKRSNPGAMRHWTNVLKKHLKNKEDFNDFWNHLEHVDYTEVVVNPSHHAFLGDTIFVRKFCNFVKIGKGEAFYDRIFVFYQDGEPVGLGKMSRHNNIGSFAPTEVFNDCFGQYNEMARIEKVLHWE